MNGHIVETSLSDDPSNKDNDIFIFNLLMLILYFTVAKTSVQLYYIIFAGLGLSVGFAIQLFTLAAENFGTNIRTLVTSSSMNLVRAWVIPCTLVYSWLNNDLGIIKWQSAAIVGFTATIIALFAMTQLDETINNDLEFVNE